MRLAMLMCVLLVAIGCEPVADLDPPPELVVIEPNEQLRGAIGDGDLVAVKQAFQAGADANHVWSRSSAASDQNSVLQLAVLQGDPAIVQALIDQLADVNLVAGGTTALHSSIAMINLPADAVDHDQQINILRLLIDNGANVNALNRVKLTPLDIVRDEEVATLLKEKGARSTAEIQDRELKEIDRQGGGILGEIPDSLDELKGREFDEEGESSTPRDTTPSDDSAEQGGDSKTAEQGEASQQQKTGAPEKSSE